MVRKVPLATKNFQIGWKSAISEYRNESTQRSRATFSLAGGEIQLCFGGQMAARERHILLQQEIRILKAGKQAVRVPNFLKQKFKKMRSDSI